MTTLWIEPFGGMAGDMFLAALLDLGDPRFTLEHLRALAESLVPGEAELALAVAWRGSLSGKHLQVKTPESADPPHRHLADLEELMESSSLSDVARGHARDVLWCIAEAEARVHGTTPDQIHFHEIGAVDTLIDVCGAALALERLEVRAVHASPPLLGEGTVRCAHGDMPVPAPAVAEILRGRPVRAGGGDGERTTPTAAAILATWVDAFEPPGAFTTRAIGYGAGTRDPRTGPPNVMRVQLGEAASPAAGSASGSRVEAWALEINLDDMTPEEVGHAVGALRAAGALEVWTSPAQMKKDRPGALVCALAREETRAALERVAFELTTTLGVRWTRVERRECGRRTITVELAGTEVRVKVRERPSYEGRSPFGERDLSPEHDDLARAAEAGGWTLREARRRAVEAGLRSESGTG